MVAVFDTPIRTSSQNLDRVLKTERPMLIVFETPDCEPCRSLEPTLREMAKEFTGRALVVLVDDSREGDLATRFRVTRAPTLVYWKEGKEIARVEGAVDAGTVRRGLTCLLGAGSLPAPTTGPSIPLSGGPSASTTTGPSTTARPSPGPSGAYSGGTTTSNGGPVVVTDSTFSRDVLQSPLPVLVDFWAPWCGPCRIISPLVEELGRQYAGKLRVAKVNTDENPLQAGQLGIMGIPTLIFFKNGREVDRVVGVVPKATLTSRLERVLNS